MKSPFTGKEVPLKTRTETIIFRRESFNIVYHYYHCEESGEEFVTPELGDLNLNQVYNQYRAKHHILFPEEIKKLREKYGLPANKMAEVLGFGINVYRNYESGEIPSESNAKLITLAYDPNEFKRLLLISDGLSDKDREKALANVNDLIASNNKITQYIDEYVMGKADANEFTGYRIPSIEKALQLVIFFAKELEPWLTSLNKLMFYADFGHYKQHGKSITGLSYRAIDYGVVPHNYGKLFAEAVDRNLVDVTYKEFTNARSEAYIGQQYTSSESASFNSDLFSDSEIDTLKKVVSLFYGKNANSIVNMNHKEQAWLQNFQKKQLVSYQYSFDLQNI